MKRFLIALLLIPCLLTGCADNAEAPAAPSEPAVQENTSDTASAELPAGAVDETNWDDIMFYKVSDIDQREMRLGDIVGQNKVTMVNIWGTFCGPCIEEMPDIEALYKQYKGDGFGVVGLTCDISYNGDIDKNTLKDALDIRSDIGITYPLLIETAELDQKFPTEYVPATFFLDKDGKVIDDNYVGSQTKGDWEKAIKKNLDKVK
ncbi:MAG: TlpA family protein disulfide reductase [Firmicutes bacterium]|nr:TlpA family protein disulfide reductase [Bacillota bacterium]